MLSSKRGLILLGLCCTVLAVEKEGDNPLDWLRDSLPGEPGVDYPIFSSVQETSFTCDGLIFGGYYADPEMECQGYHVCLQDPVDPASLFPVSFLCPNGTIFNQEVFTCDWWYNVDCTLATSLYGGVEGAFGGAGGGAGGGADGTGGAGGQCPAASPLSAEQCAGAVSNCWSPGQTDTDCPNNGLCCFDGCADLCVDGPKPSPTPRPTPRPTPPKPEPVIFEDESLSLPEVINTPRPTQKPTTGYNYEVPEIQLTISRPSTPKPGLPTLYGPPPPGKKKRSVHH